MGGVLISIRRITPLEVVAFKDVRLRALQDAPSAFASTYARESKFSDAEWLARTERWNGKRGVGFLAMDRELPCGIVGSFLNDADATRAELVSMWTAPTHRRQGVGRLLVNEVLTWAHSRKARVLQLLVTSTNQPAIRFYERLGFSRTGRTGPHPNDPAVTEDEMSRPIP
jgi:ribosomal protein S18 acetylase RimI-like enzyme